MVASFSWAGFTLSNTVLDPGRSERLATQLLDNPEVREALVDRMADALETQVPPEFPVPRAAIEAGAEVALDDPRVEALIVDGFVRVHQNALEGNAEPVIIDASALGAAGRDSLVATRPELDLVLPPVPPLNMELPTTGLSWMGTLKQLVDRYTTLGAVAALMGLSVAFAVAKDRGSVFRRVAIWGYGAAAFWIMLGYGIPRVAEILSPRSAAFATAAVDVFFGAMIRPAVTMAIIATALLAIGLLWPMLSRQRAARVMQPRNRGGAGGAPSRPTATGPVGAAAPAAAGGQLTQTKRPITDSDLIGGAGPIRTETWAPVEPIERTEQMPAFHRPVPTTPAAQTTPAAPVTPAAQTPTTVPAALDQTGIPQPKSTEWQVGRGYLDEDDQDLSPFDLPADPSATRRFQP